MNHDITQHIGDSVLSRDSKARSAAGVAGVILLAIFCTPIVIFVVAALLNLAAA